jgi:uncharacterized protein (DUF169 family)
MDLNEINERLIHYVRIQTYPVAVKFCRASQEIPVRVKFPLKDLGRKIPLCQGLALARRYGWVIAIGNEDQSCPFGALTMGFVPPKAAYLDGTFLDSIHPGKMSIEAGVAQAASRLEYGKYKYAVFAPLHRASFDPDLIVVYGNAAQVARMIQGALRKRGGKLSSSSLGGIACSSVIAKSMLEDECQYVVSGAGDRYFALTQDDELIFTMPRSKIAITLEGLIEGHEGGHHRIPTLSYLHFEPKYPDYFNKLMDFLQKKENEQHDRTGE